MGSSSKVLLVGATSLIVGVYAISLKNVQTASMKTAQSHVDRVQNERLVDAALILALDKVKNTGGNLNCSDARTALGANVTYTISTNRGDKATINLTVTKGGITQYVKAVVEKISSTRVDNNKQKQGFRKIHRGDWQVIKAFTWRS